MDRRQFLRDLSLATLTGSAALTAAAAYSSGSIGVSLASANAPGIPLGSVDTISAASRVLPPPPRTARVPLPGGGSLNALPAGGDLLALTVDDGADSEVVRLYTEFAKDTGVRLTYFVTGQYDSWTENAGLLRPLVESGQIQLGNHTWSHPDLTASSNKHIVDELTKNGKFLRDIYGVETAPYFRPPYGRHNATVDSVAASIGYTVPTLWYGSLSDSSLITEEYIVQMANQYFNPGAIVIGHLNYSPVTRVYPQLVEIIRNRKLRTVTLDDVYIKP